VTPAEPAAYNPGMRLLPLGLVLILVVTACGGASRALRAADLSAHLAATRHLTTADNERAANRNAARLLSRLVLPPGAVPLPAEPAGDRGLLRTGRNSWSGDGDRHRFWRVHAPLDSVLAFVKAHPPYGSQKPSLLWGRELASRIGEFLFPPIPRRVWRRLLLITVVALPHGWTGVRADGQAAWVVERSRAQRVPGGVREVDVRAPNFAQRVTNEAKVGTIVRWFNALPLSRSGGKCAVPTPPIVRLVFRRAGGSPLARAAVPEMYPGCVGITLTIPGRPPPGYIGDQIRFLRRLHRLLGLRVRPCGYRPATRACPR
jgi:hypothetical protein